MKTVNVNIKRLHFTDIYTIGKLYVNGVYICDTIEDKVRLLRSKYDKVYGETADVWHLVNRYILVKSLDTR